MEYACNKSKKHMSIIVAISGACLGMLTFCMLYGTKILNVSYVEWLQGPDLPQHYIGWLFFRESAWHFPIGLIDNLIYPFQISIIYTDSIPIFALLFKLISPWIPETFQYFGMWGLLSFGAMGLITASLLFRLTYRAVYSLCISVFFILSNKTDGYDLSLAPNIRADADIDTISLYKVLYKAFIPLYFIILVLRDNGVNKKHSVFDFSMTKSL